MIHWLVLLLKNIYRIENNMIILLVNGQNGKAYLRSGFCVFLVLIFLFCDKLDMLVKKKYIILQSSIVDF